jgi:hypothetical protein
LHDKGVEGVADWEKGIDMKKKTVLLTVLCIVLAVSWSMMATACNNQEEAPSDEPSSEPTQDATTSETAGEDLPNPMVESNPDEIKGQFGVEFMAPDEYAASAQYYIIAGDTAQVQYTMDSDKGSIQVTYRVAKTDKDESKEVADDFNEYATSKQVTLDGGQVVTVNMNDGVDSAGSCQWFNENATGGSVSAALSMDPVEQESQLTDVASFFVNQETKGS